MSSPHLISIVIVVVFARLHIFCDCMIHNNSVNFVDDVNVNFLTDNICVPSHFANPACYDLIDQFTAQIFNFTNVKDIDNYTSWLRLLNNMLYYTVTTSKLRRRLLDVMAHNNNKIAFINYRMAKTNIKNAAEMYRWIISTWTLAYERNDYKEFCQTLNSFRNVFHSFVLWSGSNQEYFLQIILNGFKNARAHYGVRIDRPTVLTFINMVVDYPLITIPKERIKQIFYINYVNYIENKGERETFNRFYVKVEQKTLMPFEYTVYLGKKIKININHNIVNDQSVLNSMRYRCYMVYNNFIKLYNEFMLNDTNIDMFVYTNKRLYTLMGPLWQIRTDNGGYTHISGLTKRIESHVYFDFKDDKSDENGRNDDHFNDERTQLPRNFGHELHHALLYSSVDDVDMIPKWFIEGAANRFGNELCNLMDLNFLKSNEKTTIADIIAATYSSPAILYGMGSALVDFLYEMRPQTLRRMILYHNYTIDISPQLEHHFEIFKYNHIHQCERMQKIKYNANDVMKVTQLRYNSLLKAVKSTFDICDRYILIEFKQDYFILTPSRLIKKNKRTINETIDIDDTLRSNNDVISLFDYEYMFTGMLKHALYTFGDIEYRYYFNRADVYDYYVMQIFCGKNDIINYSETAFAFDSHNARVAIFNLLQHTSIWKSFELFDGKNVEAARAMIDHLIRVEKTSCPILLLPPLFIAGENDDYSHDFVQIENLFTNLKQPATMMISLIDNSVNVTMAVDIRNNTVLHLAALFNSEIYLLLSKQQNHTIRNADNKTAQQLYNYMIRYRQTLVDDQNNYEYCFKYIDVVDKIDVNDNDQINNNNKNPIYNVYNLLYILIPSIIITNSIITILIVVVFYKCYVSKQKSSTKYKTMCKNYKFYSNDKSIIELFE